MSRSTNYDNYERLFFDKYRGEVKSGPGHYYRWSHWLYDKVGLNKSRFSREFDKLADTILNPEEILQLLPTIEDHFIAFLTKRGLDELRHRAGQFQDGTFFKKVTYNEHYPHNGLPVQDTLDILEKGSLSEESANLLLNCYPYSEGLIKAFLEDRLREYGVLRADAKVGYFFEVVKPEIADEWVKSGNLFVDAGLNQSLHHWEAAHLFQLYLFAIKLEQDGQLKSFDWRGFLSALVSDRAYFKVDKEPPHLSAWQAIMDTVRLDKFSGPFALYMLLLLDVSSKKSPIFCTLLKCEYTHKLSDLSKACGWNPAKGMVSRSFVWRPSSIVARLVHNVGTEVDFKPYTNDYKEREVKRLGLEEVQPPGSGIFVSLAKEQSSVPLFCVSGEGDGATATATAASKLSMQA